MRIWRLSLLYLKKRLSLLEGVPRLNLGTSLNALKLLLAPSPLAGRGLGVGFL
jgi:hypothetical protein